MNVSCCLPNNICTKGLTIFDINISKVVFLKLFKNISSLKLKVFIEGLK